ncbi:hypothetical protein [Mesonia sp. K4-1]|uniref:hypothetical protein n=1 Tax=Mesonia sp. K4-1 TaxID=2602760 RepID=UPI0011CA9A34|nr:hypothetical protein [Mesonia sp. K4-1]TXK76066.1 hypothetical protein FT986_07860 [Mesonia sp. K4-1]
MNNIKDEASGITLSLNLHREFDQSLITINKVFIGGFLLSFNKILLINQFEGVNIQLPKNYSHYSSQQALAWHNKEVFFIVI